MTSGERKILERLAIEPEPWPLVGSAPDGPDYRALEARRLIQWAKPPHSTVEWEITDAGREALRG